MNKTLNLAGFTGSNQATDAMLLPETMGAAVVDCEPGFGVLKPMLDHLTVATVSASPQRLSIWRMGRDVVSTANYWLASINVAHWTTGFGTDSTERTYYTGDGSPRWTNNVIGLGGGPPYPQAYRELSVPQPTAALTSVLNTDGSGTPNVRSYVYTFVNDLGWESAPSPPSTGLLCKPGAIVDLSAIPSAPAGLYGITKVRIYRTQPEDTTTTSADFFFLREVTIGTATTQDDARTLLDLIPTYAGVIGSSWVPPPADAHSILALWGGMYVFLSGKDVCYTEPGAPYACPLRFRKKVKDTAVTQTSWGQNHLVLTQGRPVMFQGVDPASMQDVPLQCPFSCQSVRSVVSFEYGALWASIEGLAFSESERLLTEGLFTREQWAAMTPSSMVAGRWGRFYVCSFTGTSPAGTGHAFFLDPLRPQDGVSYLSVGFDACHKDSTDTLFILQGANVRKFAGSSSVLTGVYTGKRFLQPFARNFSWAQVQASGYPVTLKITARKTLADGTTSSRVETRTVANAAPFRIKDGLYEDWQPEVTSNKVVQIVRLAVGITDLKAR